MSAVRELRGWKETAGHTVERSAPYVKRGSKWFIVHVLTPLLFYSKEVVIATLSTLLAGCHFVWSTLLDPFLGWLFESAVRTILWSVEETAKALEWGWNRLTPWN